jgi:hypothetical protein
MNHRIVSFFLVVAICLIAACKKNSEVFVPAPDLQIDSVWTNSINPGSQVQQLAQRLNGPLFVREFNPYIDSVIRFENNLSITLPATGLFAGTVPLSGNVKAEFVLIQKKGDYIRYGIPTVSNRFPLESGGAVFIRLSSGGQPVTVTTARKMKIVYNEAEAKQGMSLYLGPSPLPLSSTLFNWVPVPVNDNSTVKVWDSANTTTPKKGYVIETFRTGWLNVDRLLEPGASKTEASVVVPNLFSNANTAVYIVFKNVRCVVQLSGNPDLRKFSFPNLPLNMDVKIVTISKVGDSFYLGIKDEKITPGITSFVKPELSSIDQINQFLNSL